MGCWGVHEEIFFSPSDCHLSWSHSKWAWVLFNFPLTPLYDPRFSLLSSFTDGSKRWAQLANWEWTFRGQLPVSLLELRLDSRQVITRPGHTSQAHTEKDRVHPHKPHSADSNVHPSDDNNNTNNNEKEAQICPSAPRVLHIHHQVNRRSCLPFAPAEIKSFPTCLFPTAFLPLFHCYHVRWFPHKKWTGEREAACVYWCRAKSN